MKILEIFDSTTQYEVVQANKSKFVTKQTIEGRDIIFVALLDDGSAEVEFKEVKAGAKDKSGTYALTGSGGEIKVFSMVGRSLKELANRYRPDMISFTAEKEPNHTKRADIYEKLVKKFLPDYEITSRDTGNSIVYGLYKNET